MCAKLKLILRKAKDVLCAIILSLQITQTLENIKYQKKLKEQYLLSTKQIQTQDLL